ncbi:MAG: miaA [Candidatus Paceibacter sp.]|nr:miaA [Candidatus Paceibacter sp.]
MNLKPKIIVVLGPTASGKSDLAVAIAQKFNGEVISADSRQVYTGLDIGTGKISKKEMKGIPHHMLDVVSPKETFTAHDFKEQAEKIVEKIIENKKIPVICGGTGFYIQTLVDNYVLPEVPPNKKLRKKLQTKTPEELFLMLAQLDLKRASTIDVDNPRRLIRAIEIATHLGSVPEIVKNPKYDALQIGIETDDEPLKAKIIKRLNARLKKGMIKEAEKLHKDGLTWKRMEELGLEYRYLARFLQKIITEQEMIEHLGNEIWHYAKRQKTWFKRDERIKWFKLTQRKSIEKTVREFLE